MTGPEYPPEIKHTVVQRFRVAGADYTIERQTVFTYTRSDQMSADRARIVRRYEFLGYRDGVSTGA